MRKLLLSLLILAGAFTAVLAFHACSADDEAEESQHSPQAQLLLQKSREFAKKYNVNMTLNEENIEETAKTLSVEQMENDFQKWADMKCTLSLTEVNPHFKKSANKLRINRRKISYEETNISGTFSGTANNNSEISVSITYNLGNKGSGLIHVSVDYGGCTGDTSLQPVGFTTYGNGAYSFSATGTVSLSGHIYKKNYRVQVEKPQYGEMKCTVS